MAAYLMLLALVAGGGFVLFVIYSVFDDDRPRLWALRVWSAACLILLVKIGFVAGSPWNITAASFAIFWAVVYPLLCVPDGFWERLTDKLDRFWNSAEYARIEREEAQINAEREALQREQKSLRQKEAFEKRLADRKREAEEAKRWEAERECREAMRLKREAYEKSLAEEKERKRKAAVIHDLKSADHDGIPDF